MNGIEILSSEVIYNTILPEWCIPVGLGLGILCFVFMIMSFSNYYDIAGTIFLLLALGCVAIVVLGNINNKNDVNYIKYKVTIDDSVPMSEFMDKYEIIDQEGKIYTVKEKD